MIGTNVLEHPQMYLVASEEGVTTGGYGHPPGSVSRDVVGNERPSALIMHKDSLAFATTQQDKKKKTLDETGIRKRQCPSTSALKKKNHCAGVLWRGQKVLLRKKRICLCHRG